MKYVANENEMLLRRAIRTPQSIQSVVMLEAEVSHTSLSSSLSCRCIKVGASTARIGVSVPAAGGSS
jgi:hypothetical protein